MSELENWLKEQKGVCQIGKLAYRLWYNGVWCYAGITKTPCSEVVQIRPLRMEDNIGHGCGNSHQISFKRNDL